MSGARAQVCFVLNVGLFLGEPGAGAQVPFKFAARPTADPADLQFTRVPVLLMNTCRLALDLARMPLSMSKRFVSLASVVTVLSWQFHFATPQELAPIVGPFVSKEVVLGILAHMWAGVDLKRDRNAISRVVSFRAQDADRDALLEVSLLPAH